MSASSESSFAQATVEELSARLQAGVLDNLQLVDVREPHELELAQLQGFINLPLSQASEWSADIHARLDSQAEIIVMCHHGMRSAQMCQWLVQQGFTNVKNLAGGIDAYSVIVDASIPRY
jgi:rhodanese-related sulfurtransferase